MTDDTVKIDDETRRGVDGSALSASIGIDEREINWRKSFTGFGRADAERLAGMSDTFDRIAEDLVEDFYDHLADCEEAREIIGDSTKTADMLKQSKRQYLADLGSGAYGQDYFRRRARIRKIHDMLDLGPKVYLGAYHIYCEGIIRAIAEDVKQGTSLTDGGAAASPGAVDGERVAIIRQGESAAEAIDEVVGRVMSALKLLNLDQQVAMDTYMHSYSEQVEDQLERQRRLSEGVSRDVEQPVENLWDLSSEARSGSKRSTSSATSRSTGCARSRTRWGS